VNVVGVSAPTVNSGDAPEKSPTMPAPSLSTLAIRPMP
jgi:hypothetical protein